MAVLTGSTRNEVLEGGFGSETISGAAGNDLIYGDETPAGNEYITNGTFEGNALPAAWNSTVPAGWAVMPTPSGLTLSGGAIGQQVHPFTDGAGQYFSTAVTASGAGNPANWNIFRGIQQDTGAAYDSTQAYQLTLDVGSQFTNASRVYAEFVVGGTVVGTSNYRYPSGSEDTMVTDAITLNIPPGATTATGNITVRIYTITANGAVTQPIIDNVSLTSSGAFVGASDSLLGGAGNDTIYGDGGNDTIFGDGDNDLIYSGSEADSVYGGLGDDTLDGGADNDTLSGGAGSNNLTGGSGDDRFIIEGGAADSVFLSDFGAGETAGANTTQTDNDFVDLTPWYNASTLALYNSTYGTSFTNPLQAMQHDAATSTPGTLDFIAFQGGPTVTFTLVGSGVMNTEHTGVICFARGTLIETNRGPMPIEKLRHGTLVATLDQGFQPVRWIGSRRIGAEEMQANPKLRPIRIRAGSMGAGLPERDLVVSPQHRLMVTSRIAERIFGSPVGLVAARHLVGIAGIEVATDLTEVDYFHFLLDDHRVVFAEGAPAESMYTGTEALKMVSDAAREEIFAIFPELQHQTPETLPVPARPIFCGKHARKLVERHEKNDVPLLRAV
ncbi:Hint domain-containing protein [Fuscovulum blasticum]|uniref:Hint domain-containing protein n=1 Tax=Fuscovulum blasticum TaxID=1075 RepID=UPI000D3E507D|nr:Hint domain-containing protein [Fuscovulum blasticum]AWD23691.1 hypothetical protein B6K69_17835 [Fuscovulum blasticum]